MAYRVVYRGIFTGQYYQSKDVKGRFRTKKAAQTALDKFIAETRFGGMTKRFVMKAPRRRKK